MTTSPEVKQAFADALAEAPILTEIRDRLHTPGSPWDNIQDIQAKLNALAADDAVDDATTARILAIADDVHNRILPVGAGWDNIQDIQSKLASLASSQDALTAIVAALAAKIK